jgi:hypothetical protein
MTTPRVVLFLLDILFAMKSISRGGKKELLFLEKYNTPNKIQDYLDSIPFNFERKGETCMSPLRVLKSGKAHCIEGAMFAAAALYANGEKPLVMNFKVAKGDVDHCVALYKKNGYWGAISKTNHAVLRFRDPVYKTPRELAMSFYHEYFLSKDGKKTLKGYSPVINLLRFGKDWIISKEDLWDIAEYVFEIKHIKIVPKINEKYIRKVSRAEIVASDTIEWTKSEKRVKN